MRLILTGDNAGRVVEDWLADEIGADTVDTVEAARIVREWNAEYVQTETGVISPDMKRAWARSLQLEAEVARLKRHRLVLTAWMRMFRSALDAWSKTERGQAISIRSIVASWDRTCNHGALWVAEKMGGV